MKIPESKITDYQTVNELLQRICVPSQPYPFLCKVQPTILGHSNKYNVRLQDLFEREGINVSR